MISSVSVLTSRFFTSLVIPVAFAGVFLSCAGQAPPGGGPVDAVPPTVIRTVPDTNATRVNTDNIVLEFSEYVDRRSVEESIFISPYVGQLEFEWSGREVEILFDEPLRENRTYVLNIGTDVIDVRARNRMAHGFTLAFATGDSLDRGAMKGKVFDAKPEGLMMFAYALDGIQPDTLDPSNVRPEYIMQTGNDGTFAFSNIRWGSYRILAVRDEYRNLIYDKQIDQFGVTTRDVTIDERRPIAEDFWFRLSSEDTTKPFLAKVQPVHRSNLSVRFSEPIDTASLTSASILLQDSLTNDIVGIALRSLERSDSSVATLLTSSLLDSGKAYRLAIHNVRDRAGNLIDSANASYVFLGVATSDTMRPGFSIVGIQDSIREISVRQSFEIRFSEPVKQAPLVTAIAIFDSLSARVPLSMKWLGASSVILHPRSDLQSKMWYSIRIVLDSLHDIAGNTFIDSTRSIRFQTLDLRTTGIIEGVVADEDTGSERGGIFLTATQVHSSTPYGKTVRLEAPGKFALDQLPEGHYTLSAFLDRDSSQSYSYGAPFPFQTAERFAVYGDTVKVRARWGVEGVTLLLKRRAGK